MELKRAFLIANEIAYLLSPECEIVNVAGSIRREKPEVKDIEIVCLPKKEVLKDMFGYDEGVIVDLIFQNKVENLGRTIKGKADGRYMQIELPQGINLDLFMPAPNDYYRQLAIRTGSTDYSHQVIAKGWKKLGWCGSDVGLRKILDCVQSSSPYGKTSWKCINPNAELPPVWKSEKEFFNWINVKWVNPSQRQIK